MIAADPSFEPVRFAERYTIEREIGRGGGAVVYLAADEPLRRHVAIKVLLRDIASIVSTERFLREVRIAANLMHPHIVQVFDTGVSDGLPYYTMPFVPGETLRSLMARQPRAVLADAVRIVCEIADALNYAHAAGVVHRDIKPENILMAGDHAMVADFGIAKAMNRMPHSGDRGANITTTDGAPGTLPYMSPEQLMDDETLDGRSDIYSLATMFYEMLTGTLPYGGHTAAEMFALRLTEAAPRLQTSRDDVPEAIDLATQRALHREPSRRFATAREFAQELAAVAPSGPATTEEREAAPAIAVLPFTSHPPDPDGDYFSAGITEGVIRAIGLQRRVRVIARTSVMPLAGIVGGVQEIGRQLGVQWLLEGTIRREGNEIRISVNLVSVADGIVKLNRTFKHSMDGTIALQEEIAHSIADAVRPSLLGTSPPTRPSTDRETYLSYLKGRHYLALKTPDGMTKAAECFRDVVARDPDFALGHAGIADVHHSQYIYGYVDPLKSLPLARDAALRAIRLDPFAGEPRAALGTVRAVLDWDWRESEAEFRRAIELYPAYPSSYGWFANYCLIPRGRFDDALNELERGRAVEPLSPHISGSFGMAYYYMRRYDDADAECRSLIELAPQYPLGHYFLGRSLVERGRFDEAIDCFRTLSKISGGHPHVPAELGYLYAKQGDRARAEAELSMLKALGGQRFVSSCLSAQVHVALGDLDQAMLGFERGFAEHSTDLLWLGIHPGLDAMRQDVRFVRLIGRIGLIGQDTGGAQAS